MKKQFYLAFLPLLLTGCLSKSVSKEKMADVISQAENNITTGSFTNVHVNDKLQYKYDYKEGEFYREYMFALLLVVPITDLVCTWQEDGKYYHYENHSATSKKVDEEITKEQFDVYMLAHKETMKNLLMSPIKESKKIMYPEQIPAEDPTKYTSVKDVSYKSNLAGSTFTLKGTGVYTVDIYQDGQETKQEKEQKDTIKYSNNLPTEWSCKNDGEKKWNYKYGKAEFLNPKTEEKSK